ncbi:GDSL-like lipase/acylhydrolase family protein [Herbihabitans rhizosphaerae]|uniref:GDSL-like lipase/acylhydrolase family protein n=1 Tax=Herbihabitans rhizosphaerae TaxID=1872711 RepID=A0A4Q7KHS1_9PSEU|nr:SGNH/GDSL hydrolase family protein [Herbihabitans rhizosphaerae]RZS32807.1 GDSL-like lipase/acylhydrolase family protein [Herbihabitans rhizosphaerae]
MSLRSRRSSAVVAIAAAAVLTMPGTAAASAGYQRYVGLGDSFSAVGTLTKIRTDPLGCAKTTDNLPAGVAARVKPAAFVDISCGAATTEHMTAPQDVVFGPNAPQFSALTADTDLVTFTIGGNDVGFGDIVRTCGVASFTDPLGAPCKAHYTQGGVDELDARIAAAAPKVAAVLDGIKQRSPRAVIVAVGYLRVLPPTGGCWPLVPVARGDVVYINEFHRKLNAMVGVEAARAGARFVDPLPTTGHDACQLPWNKWVEGLIPTSLSVPVHPNAAGQAHVASLVARELAGSAG